MLKNALIVAKSFSFSQIAYIGGARGAGCVLVLRSGGSTLLVGLAVSIAIGGPLMAEGLSISSRSGSPLFKSQTQLLDDRAAKQYSNSVTLLPPRAIVPGTWPGQPYLGTYDGPYLDVARSAALRNNVPPDLFLRLIEQESGWDIGAVSDKGAIGLAQLMPQTARNLRVDPGDPLENLDGGARYLRRMYDQFGDWRLALAAYNAGPGAVEKFNGVPPYAETQDYVVAIWGQ